MGRVMMETIKLAILAAVQGLTEFLPVSSSGHLVLAGKWLNVSDPGPQIEILLHAGTLAAVCVYYRRRIAALLVSLVRGGAEGWRYAGFILVSMLPAALLYMRLEDKIKGIYDAPRGVAVLLIANGVFLLASGLPETIRRRSGQPTSCGTSAISHCGPTALRALAMGCGQAIAMLPGISRSGASISAGRLVGMGAAEAAEFSFLMSVPVIAGATLLEARDAFGAGAAAAQSAAAVSPFSMAIAMVVAAITGYAALAAVVRLLARGRFSLFGIWCIGFGGTALAFL